MKKASALRLTRLYRAAGRRVRIFRHRGTDWRNRHAFFYTVSLI